MTQIDLVVKAVLFDHDDTLVQTIQAKWAEHRHVARIFYGRQISDAEFAEHWGKPLPQLLTLLYGDPDASRAMRYNASVHTQFPKKLFPCTVPVLESIAEAGILIGLVTGTERWSLQYDLASLGIQESRFDYLQTCEDTRVHKPNPAVFLPAIQWLAVAGVQPAETVYIGDGLQDLAAARAAGFQFAGVCTGLVTRQMFGSHGAACVDSLADLRFCPC